MSPTPPPDDTRYTIGPRGQYTQVPRDALWDNPRVKHLAMDAKAVFVCLLTNPLVDAAGIVRTTPAALAERLCTTTADAVDTALAELERSHLVHRCGDEVFVTGWFEIAPVLDGPLTFRAFATAERRISHAETRACVHAWLTHAARCRSELSGGLIPGLVSDLHSWGDAHGVDFGSLKKKSRSKPKKSQG